MSDFKGRTLSWQMVNGAIELALHRDPCNEIGSLTLDELEKFAAALPGLGNEAHALIVHSTLKAGFSAGADLRELFQRGQEMEKGAALRGVRKFLERIHSVLNALDAAPLTSARGDVWRRVRAGIGLRHYYCGPHGAILLSGTATRADSGLRRDSASEA
jgi:hypothetical protein